MSNSLTGSLLEMLSGPALEQLSGQLGADKDTTQKALTAALPTLLGALGRNASQPEGAEALLRALTRDHNGSVLQDVGGFISRGGNMQDGNGILGHVLGSQRRSIEQGISQATGLSADSTGNLLAMLAPLVMGSLGQAQRSGGLDAASLADLLMGERQKAESQLGGMAKWLDFNGDGSILDEVMNIGSKLLGGLFGRK
jgi:hypothetical protein